MITTRNTASGIRRATAAVAGLAALGTMLGGTASAAAASAAPAATAGAAAEPAWIIPDVSPRPYQIVGKVEKFADFGNYDKLAPTGAHWCQAPGRDTLEQTIAGRSWMFVEDYTTDAESLYKNDATITVSGWRDGRTAFAKLAADKLMCTWLNPQRRVTWQDKNPERFWLSTSGKVNTKFQWTAALRVGPMVVSVTAQSTNDATARRMATRMAVGVERNLRATDLVRAAG